jgi:hypothetical protein
VGGLAVKVTRSQWILVATACLIVAASAAQPGTDLPPGANGSNWVPISDSAGILLTNVSGMPDALRLQLQGSNPDTFPLRGTGILMVKYGGGWRRVDLDLPAARLQQLH